jgi:excisionase family DNA binding protein
MSSGASGAREPLRLADRLALPVAQAAELLSISERTLRTLLAEDPTLPRVHLGRRVVIPVCELEAWINRRAQEERQRERRAVRALLAPGA